MRRTIPQAPMFAVAALVLLAGCATVPQESIELSATIGRDLEQVHLAHRNLAELHFAHLAEDIDLFVDDVYRPEVIAAAADSLGLVEVFQDAVAEQGDLDPLDVLEIFVEEATAQIEAFRGELQAPLTEQRRRTVQSIDAAFQQLQTANTVVTAHLASVRKVHDAQAEALRLAGLEDYRERLTFSLVELSEGVRRALERAGTVDARLDELPGEIRALTERLP